MAAFLQALAFSFLPWFGFFIAEFFGRTPARIFVADKRVTLLSLFAASIYLSIALATALLAFAASIPVSRVFFRAQFAPSLKVVRLAMISCLTPWSLLMILKLSKALSNVPLGIIIVGIPLAGTFLVLVGLTTLYAFIGKEDRRIGLTSLLAALGIIGWLGLALRFQGPNPWRLDISLYTPIALGLLMIVARTVAFGGRKIPFPRLQKNSVILLFSLGLPILVLIISHSLGHIRVKATKTSASVGKPNVVVFLPDTVRADHCSVYGYGRQTTKKISEEIGLGWTLFQNAASQATSTRPSVKSLFTSQAGSSWGFDAYSDPPPRNAYTLAKAFLEAGYRTACFSGVGLVEGEGFETGFERFVS
ncbi:MAG: sulfatase-like hydrolase/transferase [Acidobacteriota bacterium]